MTTGRRKFLEVGGLAVAGAGLLSVREARASEGTPAGDAAGVLVDTTLCVGCRGCEAACSEANGLPPPPEGDEVLAKLRTTSQTVFTVVNRTEKSPGVERFGKKQCMHCLAPACASACPVRAMDKLASGPVVYDASKCMGCRYCMIACPFDIPKYEYESVAPRVRKCTFCAERQKAGLRPACAEVCPSGALTFGKRDELLDAAKARIYQNPDRYAHAVYGEEEAGGTSWLYLADVDLAKLGFRTDVPDRSFPDLVSGALGAPPFVMTLWPPLLMGLYAFSQGRGGGQESHGDASHADQEDGHG